VPSWADGWCAVPGLLATALLPLLSCLRGALARLLGHGDFGTRRQAVVCDARDVFTHLSILDPYCDPCVILRFCFNAIVVCIHLRTEQRLAQSDELGQR
jgi:hypothetical protein